MRTRYSVASYLLATILGLHLATGCGDEALLIEPTPLPGPGEIIFSRPMELEAGELTRAPKEAFNTNDQFAVLGYCVPTTVGSTELNYASSTAPWSSKYLRCTPHIFYKTEITVGSNICNYNDIKYWYRYEEGKGYDINNAVHASVAADADDYLYSFFAYFPTNSTKLALTAPASATTVGAPKFTYTMFSDNGSTATARAMLTEDPMLACCIDHQRTDGHVKLQFEHLLTSLSFKMVNYGEDNNGNKLMLTIHSVKVQGDRFHRTLEVDCSSGAPVSTYGSAYYSGTYTISGTATTLSSGTTWIVGEPLMLPAGTAAEPLAKSGRAVNVIIDYTFNNSRRTATFKINTDSFAPKPGVNYVFQFNWLGGDNIVMISPKAEVWEDGEADDGREDNDDIIFS